MPHAAPAEAADGVPAPAATTTPPIPATGLTGDVELWDETRPFPRMRSTVEATAGLTVQEGRRQSPKLSKWSPFEGLVEAA